MSELTITRHINFYPIISMAIAGLTDHTQRAYEKALTEFMSWYTASSRSQLDKAAVNEYKSVLSSRGLSAATINLRLSAIRKLASEAADNGLIDQTLAAGIGRVKGVKAQGVRAGNWLTLDQAQALINAPDVATLKGLRDRSILAMLLGCGLRRAELAALTFDHIQQRDGRWVIVDIIGKGGRVRTIPMPSWAKAALDSWAERLIWTTGNVFYSFRKGDHLDMAGMTPQAVRDVVVEYSQSLGFVNIASHDLRRTFAKLAHKGGSGLDQIQLSLGHASIQTTERYLGVTQNLTDAPCDHLGLHFSKP